VRINEKGSAVAEAWPAAVATTAAVTPEVALAVAAPSEET
jgi:hypothetical protein